MQVTECDELSTAVPYIGVVVQNCGVHLQQCRLVNLRVRYFGKVNITGTIGSK